MLGQQFYHESMRKVVVALEHYSITLTSLEKIMLVK